MSHGGAAEAAQAMERAFKLATERDDWPRKNKLYVSDMKHAVPTDMGGDCKRKLKGKLEDEPQEPKGHGLSLMFTLGDLIHDQLAEWMEEYLGENWQLVASEENAREVKPLRGRFDYMLVHEDTGYTVIVDAKTKRGNSFRYLDEPKLPDVRQVQTYIKAKDADAGVLVYVDREGQNWMKFFPVQRDDEVVESARDELVRIREANAEDIPLMKAELKRNHNKGRDSIRIEIPWQIEWCPLKTCHCKQALPGGVPFGKVVAYVNDNDEVTMKDGYENERWRDEMQRRVDEGLL